jgi:hypothetical protein
MISYFVNSAAGAVAGVSSDGATVGCPFSASADPGALPAASVCISWLPAASAAPELSVSGVVDEVPVSPDAGRPLGIPIK